MANDIIKFTSKDYKSIFSDLTDAIPAISGTWTSREDGDPGIVLVKLMSALGDMLSYNFDKQANEYYAPSVTQRKNAAKLFELIGYKMRWYRSAKTTVTLTNATPLEAYEYIYKQIADDMQQPGDISFVIPYYNEYVELYPPFEEDEREYITIPPTVDGETFPLPAGLDEPFKIDVTNLGWSEYWQFATDSRLYFEAYQNDPNNLIYIHRNLADALMSISLYGQSASALTYSLEPTTVNKIPNPNSITESTTATDILKPYAPVKFNAIQGYLNKISFTKAQLKNNRYYVPDSQLDDTYMYLSYTTIDSATLLEKTVFISKTDNLLTVTQYNYDEITDVGNQMDEPKIYFQFGIDDFDYPYIELSSYWEEQLGSDGITFTFYYFKTLGRSGSITTNYLSTLGVSNSNNIMISNLSNTDYIIDDEGNTVSSPGFNPQTAADAYVDSLNYIMTYDTLVTIYDFTRFTKRQDGISNAFACDGQYAKDLNDKIHKQCKAYTEEQLRSILGPNADIIAPKDNPSPTDKDNLAEALYEIRRVYFDFTDSNVTAADAMNPNDGKDFIKYGLNLYPIVGNFDITDTTMDNLNFAVYDNSMKISDTVTKYAPYMLYRINTYDGDVSPSVYKYATMLTEKIDETRIVITEPMFDACRVFPWRVCGTLHLTQMVTQNDADNIIKNVINYLANLYRPQNVKFGQKLTYMEIIDAILASDSRIRYFDAGIGNNKLIVYENQVSDTGDSKYFNIEAYFNPISIMRYVQTYDENHSEDSPYCNMLIIDPSYIQQMR